MNFAQGLFKEIVRPRKNIVKFSNPRVVLADDPHKKLEDLFSYYIERNFVTKEYRETILEKGMKKLFLRENINSHFIKEKIGDEEYQVSFPFVQKGNNRPVKIIKPLNLSQNTSSKIIEHGGNWWFRIRELKKRQALPSKVLFAVDGPQNKGDRTNAYNEAVDMLSETGVTVISFEDRERILDFALN